MRVGDLLEWFAAAAFIAAAYLATNLAWPSVLVAALALTYFAQCYADQSIKRPRPRLRSRLVKAWGRLAGSA